MLKGCPKKGLTGASSNGASWPSTVTLCLDSVGGRGGDLALVEINPGVPLQMRGDGFVWLAEAVVIGGAFHVGDELGFLEVRRFRCRTTDGNQKQAPQEGFEHVHGCDLVRQGSASVTNP